MTIVALVAVRDEVAGGITIGDCAALATLPFTWRAVRRLRTFSWVMALAFLAVVTGLVLSLAAVGEFPVISSVRRSNLVFAAALPGAAAAFVWASRVVGQSAAAAAFGAGMVLDTMSLLDTNDNPWKFGLGTAVAVCVTAATQHAGRGLKVVIVAALAVSFLAADARSTTSFLLLAMLALLGQAMAEQLPAREWSPAKLQFNQFVLLAGFTAVAMVGVTVASLSGYLGEEAQTRTAAQAGSSTNLLLAARPELGASVALLSNRPWGYGAGVAPRYEDIRIAMDGMKALGYDPDNGYVERYMFGHGFELHSGLADAWIALSLPGAALMLFAVFLAARCLWRDLGTLHMRTWLLIASLIAAMNVAVGPLVVAVPYVALVIGAALADEDRFASLAQRHGLSRKGRHAKP